MPNTLANIGIPLSLLGRKCAYHSLFSMARNSAESTNFSNLCQRLSWCMDYELCGRMAMPNSSQLARSYDTMGYVMNFVEQCQDYSTL